MCDSADRTEAMCHLDGMLDRDQRTAVTCRFTRVHDDSKRDGGLAGEAVHHDCPCVSATHHLGCDSTKTRSRSRKQRWSYRVARRFKEVLVVGVYILSLIHIPAHSWGAPATHRLREKRSSNDMADRMNSVMKWTIPCGVMQEDTTSQDGEADLIGHIITQADIALQSAKGFRESYVHKTFNVDFNKHHESWKQQKYDWLPRIDKNIGETVPPSHLEQLDLNKSLLDIYEYLQTVAVGLEQVVWDMEDNGSSFYGNFREVEGLLRILLCEIQYTIQQKRIPPRKDIVRDVMPEDFRQMVNCTHRNLRDWLIFRDYMNLLEYVIQVFEYLKG